MNQHNLFAKISPQIQELNTIPLFGSAPALNLEILSHKLQEAFAIPDLSLRLKAQQWKEKSEIKEGLKGKLITTSFVLSPIDSPIFWTLAKTDLDKLTAHMLLEKPPKKAFTSPLLQEGYYRFLTLEVLSILQTLAPVEQLSLQLSEDQILPDENAVCIDIEITFHEITIWGRLFIPETFRKNWVQHFSAFPPQYVPTHLSRHLPLTVGIKIGSVQLLSKEWKKIKMGDFLLPDIISTDERGVLMFNQTPLFQVHIHPQEIKLIDFALTPEEPMEEHQNTLSHKLDSAEEEVTPIKDIPLQISIEMARLKITLDELMNLSPGSLLELPPLADKRVSLIANGQKIGVAELIYLGEALGLKILEI